MFLMHFVRLADIETLIDERFHQLLVCLDKRENVYIEKSQLRCSQPGFLNEMAHTFNDIIATKSPKDPKSPFLGGNASFDN
jgi:hypothetical protein